MPEYVIKDIFSGETEKAPETPADVKFIETFYNAGYSACAQGISFITEALRYMTPSEVYSWRLGWLTRHMQFIEQTEALQAKQKPN